MDNSQLNPNDDSNGVVPSVSDDQSDQGLNPPTLNPTPARQKEAGVSDTVAAEAKIHDIAEGDKVAKSEGDEYWENYAREIELEKEIAELGVEKVESGEVKLPENLASQMGIKASVNIDTPMSQTNSNFSVSGVSLTDDQINVGIKTPPHKGFRWLVEWFIYQLRKAHYIVKLIRGKVTRSSQ